MHRLVYVRLTAPMKLVVCATKTALHTRIQCALPMEQRMTTNAYMSQATARDWTIVLCITLEAARVGLLTLKGIQYAMRCSIAFNNMGKYDPKINLFSKIFIQSSHLVLLGFRFSICSRPC